MECAQGRARQVRAAARTTLVRQAFRESADAAEESAAQQTGAPQRQGPRDGATEGQAKSTLQALTANGFHGQDLDLRCRQIPPAAVGQHIGHQGLGC